MAALTGLGIGLSLVFGSILLGLVAELFYLLWWKKRRVTCKAIDIHRYTNHAKELLWKKPNSQQVTSSVTKPNVNYGHEPDLEFGSGGPAKDFPQKGFDDDDDDDEGVESELKRLHNLWGPPRFLFTIKEETKEDLESDDGRSRGDRSRKGSRTRSLSDVLLALETPILTPLASPTLKAHHHHHHPLESYNQRGFNPLFESFSEAELNRLRSSPPPKFKFLRDAEEKLMRRLIEEAEKMAFKQGGSVQYSDDKAPPSSVVPIEEINGSFIRLIVGKNKEIRENGLQYHSTASQVLPLASSPTTFKPLDSDKPIKQLDLHELT